MKSFGNKLLVKILGTTIAAFVITIVFISNLSVKSSQESAQKYVQEKADAIASKFQGQINSAINVINTFYADTQSAVNHNKKLDEKEFVDKLKYTLDNNGEIIGLWATTKKSDLLFNPKSDNSNIPDEWYTDDNAFNPYVTKLDGQIIVQKGTKYNESNEFIKGAMSH